MHASFRLSTGPAFGRVLLPCRSCAQVSEAWCCRGVCGFRYADETRQLVASGACLWCWVRPPDTAAAARARACLEPRAESAAVGAPRAAARREVLERAALDNDEPRPQHGRVHLDERDHVEQRPVAREAGKVQVDGAEARPEVERRPYVERVEHLEPESRMRASRALDALSADVGSEHMCARLREQPRRRSPDRKSVV